MLYPQFSLLVKKKITGAWQGFPFAGYFFFTGFFFYFKGNRPPVKWGGFRL